MSTNNCRLEGMKASKLYSPAFSLGKRCVVLCEGFYEWQTTKKEVSSKQPYYIYSPQEEKVCMPSYEINYYYSQVHFKIVFLGLFKIKIEDRACWNAEWNETEGWKGPKLLKLAGLFNCWVSPEVGGDLYVTLKIKM